MSRRKLLPHGRQTAAPIPIPEDGALSVGREPPNELPLYDGSVSREHALLEADPDRCTVRDLESANGTFVNGKRITNRRLRRGDRVRFGPRLEFLYLEEREPPAWRERVRSLVRHALVSRDPEAEKKKVVIGGHGVIVGRSAQATLRLRLSQISEVHARLENRSGLPWVVDVRSRNGTFVNGEPVKAQRLHAGDEVAFADQPFDVELSSVPTLRGWLAGSALMTIAALSVFLATWSPAPERESLWTRAMYEETVRTSLGDALAAYDRSPPSPEVARAQFDIAVRSLQAADRLPPGKPDDAQIEAAFSASSSHLKSKLAGRDLYKIYFSLTAVDSAPPPPPEEDVVRAELERILAEFGIDPMGQEIPPRLVAEVERFVAFWTGPQRGYTQRSIERARPHLAMIRREMREHHLPEVFCYLPFVESGYRSEATSTAGAQGMWQFMPKTGRSYGLRVDDTADERTDPVMATRAACRYIDGLLNSFGADAFMCATAAYNKGEYGMVTCLKRAAADSPGAWRSKWKFWDLVERGDGCLKQETVEYVPRFLAAAIVMRRPEAFGLQEDGS